MSSFTVSVISSVLTVRNLSGLWSIFIRKFRGSERFQELIKKFNIDENKIEDFDYIRTMFKSFKDFKFEFLSTYFELDPFGLILEVIKLLRNDILNMIEMLEKEVLKRNISTEQLHNLLKELITLVGDYLLELPFIREDLLPFEEKKEYLNTFLKIITEFKQCKCSEISI